VTAGCNTNAPVPPGLFFTAASYRSLLDVPHAGQCAHAGDEVLDVARRDRHDTNAYLLEVPGLRGLQDELPDPEGAWTDGATQRLDRHLTRHGDEEEVAGLTRRAIALFERLYAGEDVTVRFEPCGS